MNTRIKKLREQSLNAINRISHERASLITGFYESDIAGQVSIPMQRALAFEYIIEHKHICINDGELIVGERGEAPKATPTYPEICLHSIDDLEILDSRPKVSFKVCEETKKVYADKIIPHWKGKTQRDRIFNSLDDKWKDAYEAGIFTEFQEQRAPGHTVGGNKIYQKGMLDLIKEINHAIDSLDFYTDRNAYDKREELRAMAVTAAALIKYSERHAKALEKIIAIEIPQIINIA